MRLDVVAALEIGHCILVLVFEAKAERNARKQDADGKTLAAYGEWLAPRLVAGADTGLDTDALREATRAWVGEAGIKFGVLFQPLRCVLTGASGGADLFDVMALLGPDRVLRRIEAGLGRLVS